LRNDGPAVGRQVAVVFPGLPAGIILQNASGISPAGDPYINMQNGIPRGGLDTRTFTDVVTIVFDNPTLTPGRLRHSRQSAIISGSAFQC